MGRLHGDKAVWRLLHSGRYAVSEVPVDGPVPVDVDTWQDYAALVADDESRLHR
jgi:molybdenum cofactor cytidylyltransferase